MDIFAKRLLALRKKSHLSQLNVAKALEIAPNSYRRYEHNEREPMATTIAAMARFFGVSADYLLGLKEEPSQDA